MGIAAVSFKDKNGIEIVVYPQGEWDTIDFDATDFDEDTDMIVYDTKADAPKDNLSKLDITASVDGKKILRLRETATYTCRLKDVRQEGSDQICKNHFFFKREE